MGARHQISQIGQRLKVLIGWGRAQKPLPPPAPKGRLLTVVPPAVDEPATDVHDASDLVLSEIAIADLLELQVVTVAPGEDEEVARLGVMVADHIEHNPRQLASFPVLAMRVLDQLSRSDVQMGELISTITQDAAISAALLRVANSSFFFRGVPVANVTSAVTHIGLTHVAEIAIGIATRSLYRQANRPRTPFDDLWQRLFHRSMTVAFASGALARTQHRGGAERAFTGGLFADVGQTVVLRALSELLAERRIAAPPSRRVIERLLDALHVPLGAQMVEEWELPEHIVQICRHHHDRDLAPELTDVHIVRLASSLNALRVRPDVDSPLAADVRQSGAALRLDRRQFLAASQQVRDFADKVTEVFAVSDAAD